MANSLAEYLISIGFDVKQDEQDKMKAAVREGSLQADLLFGAIKKSVQAFRDMMIEFADGLEQLYYTSLRTRSSVENIQALQAAAEKTGASANSASAALEGFSKFLRFNYGGDRLVKQWSGVSDAMWRTMDTSQKLQATIQGIARTHAYPVQMKYAELLGIPEDVWRAMSDPAFAGQMEAYEKKYREIQAAVGNDNKKAAESARDLNNSLRDLGATMDAIGQKATGDSFTPYTDTLKTLQLFLQANGRNIADTISTIAKAILEFVTDAMKIGGALPLLHDMIELMNALAHALKFVADQFDRLTHNGLAKAILSGVTNGISPLLPGPMGSIFGLGNILGGSDDNEHGSDGSGSADGAGDKSWWGKAKSFYRNNAPAWAGGNVKPLPAHGSLATHQQEAYAAARGEGLSDTAARALVANMSGESLRNPSDTSGDGGTAQGIVQWHPDRAQAIKDRFGKYPAEMTVAEQTRAAIWEMRNNNAYRESWNALNGKGTAEDMVGTLVSNYERPKNTGGATRTRLAYLKGFTPQNPVADRTVPKADWFSTLGISPANAAAAPSPAPPPPMGGHGGPDGAHYNPWGDLSGVGGFDIRPYPPAGDTNSTTNNHTSSLDQTTNIHVYGVGDGHGELGQKISSKQASLNADLIRNMQNSSVG